MPAVPRPPSGMLRGQPPSSRVGSGRISGQLGGGPDVHPVPDLEPSELRKRERALQIVPYARQMAQILRFAVAAVEAREDAEDFRGALGGERGINRDKTREVEVGVGFPDRAALAAGAAAHA